MHVAWGATHSTVQVPEPVQLIACLANIIDIALDVSCLMSKLFCQASGLKFVLEKLRYVSSRAIDAVCGPGQVQKPLHTDLRLRPNEIQDGVGGVLGGGFLAEVAIELRAEQQRECRRVGDVEEADGRNEPMDSKR